MIPCVVIAHNNTNWYIIYPSYIDQVGPKLAFRVDSLSPGKSQAMKGNLIKPHKIILEKSFIFVGRATSKRT